MCRVKAKIMRGPMKSECVAYITIAGGFRAEIVLNSTHTGHNHIFAAEVARDKSNVLIELPQETSSGNWRVWVKKSQILNK